LKKRQENQFQREQGNNFRLSNDRREWRKTSVNRTNRETQNQQMHNTGRCYRETDYERGIRSGKELAIIEKEETRNRGFETEDANGQNPTGEDSIEALW